MKKMSFEKAKRLRDSMIVAVGEPHMTARVKASKKAQAYLAEFLGRSLTVDPDCGYGLFGDHLAPVFHLPDLRTLRPDLNDLARVLHSSDGHVGVETLTSWLGDVHGVVDGTPWVGIDVIWVRPVACAFGIRFPWPESLAGLVALSSAGGWLALSGTRMNQPIVFRTRPTLVTELIAKHLQ